MNDFKNWDYSSNLNPGTNQNIDDLLKKSSKIVKEFIDWLVQEEPTFLLLFRGLIITRMISNRHDDIAEELFNKKLIFFDEKMAEEFSFSLGLKFDRHLFDYFYEKAQIKESFTIKKFWKNFLTYQFLRPEEIMENISNLEYVFEKIPFYASKKEEMKNKYIIDSRKEFFKHQKDHLQFLDFNTIKVTNHLMNRLTHLVALKYPEFKEEFDEEFFHFPTYCSIFEKIRLKIQLNQKLDSKEKIKSLKI
jgi:hypothetical protein